MELKSWGIECECERCVEELAVLEKWEKEREAEKEKEGKTEGAGEGTGEGEGGAGGGEDVNEKFPGLEKELKEGLGLM